MACGLAWPRSTLPQSSTAELDRRAEAAEDNRAISSDDPEAIQRLREKFAAVEAHQDRWKAINSALRSKDPAQIEALGLNERERRSIELSPCGTGYATKNASAEIRRIQRRIEELTARQNAPVHASETIGAVVIDEGDNRVRVRFPSKPAPEVIHDLEAHGFHWSRTEGVWQRLASEQAWHWACVIAQKAVGGV